MECKRIVKYLNDGLYCVLVPVYYEFEKLPAWRKYFIGKKEECENIFVSVPDYLNATADENKTHKHYIIQEYNFYISIGKTEKANNLKNNILLYKKDGVLLCYHLFIQKNKKKHLKALLIGLLIFIT